ncbi:dihydrofolate reductase [Linderina pennispora]|nr:dihydrofolate reductase [Linderina pennispora]
MTVSQKPLLLVVAAAQNNGIGINNDLPWRLRKDMAYFNQATTTTTQTDPSRPVMNACIMGRRTWESIPPKHRPLNNRYNIVVSRNASLLDNEDAPYTVVVPTMPDALQHIEQLRSVCIERVCVVGGSGIYKEALEAQGPVQVLLTRVQFAEADKCDAFFPEFSSEVFARQTHERLEQVAGFPVPSGPQTENGIDYEFTLYEKF